MSVHSLLQEIGKSQKRKREPEKLKPSKKVKTPGVLDIYTDGACTANGSKKARGGIGVYFGKKDPRNYSGKLEGQQTNNRAELTAILRALLIVGETQKDAVMIRIHSDSEYCIRGLSGRNKICKNADLFEQIFAKMKQLHRHTVEFVKVAGHSGAKDPNYYVDKLARAGVNKK